MELPVDSGIPDSQIPMQIPSVLEFTVLSQRTAYFSHHNNTKMAALAPQVVIQTCSNCGPARASGGGGHENASQNSRVPGLA